MLLLFEWKQISFLNDSIYLEEFLRKKFNDEVTLEPCVDSDVTNDAEYTRDNLTNIVWTVNDANRTQIFVRFLRQHNEI